MSEIKHTYGWVKDKYNPQAVYHRPMLKILPPATTNSQLFPAVQNQDGVGICSGFSWSELLYTVALQIGQPVDRFSENWNYNGARYLEGTLLQDAGAANDDIITWLTEHGCLLEKYWPFLDKLDISAPSSLRESETIKYPDFTAIRVDNDIEGIKSAMADKHCVVVGAPWFEEWEKYSDGILPVPTASSIVAGGHDTIWGDYDDAKGAFFCQNSWDVTWGINGRFWVPYEAIAMFKANGGYDCHYVTFSPAVTPTPVKKGCFPAGSIVSRLFKGGK